LRGSAEWLTLVGGLGASGGTAEQDEACVLAAAVAAGFAIE
jgi:uncharacterized protein GlcG (DUF336 family)